jgi:hypothetical protein
MIARWSASQGKQLVKFRAAITALQAQEICRCTTARLQNAASFAAQARHERQAFEQMRNLLIFDQCDRKLRERLATLLRASQGGFEHLTVYSTRRLSLLVM